jgi:HD-like signal output (HDOD) protein
MSATPLTPDVILSRLDELPTLPTIVYELSQVINDPMSSTSDVEKIMANDPSLTATVLRLVNSSYYAIPGGVSSLARAIGYIGFDTVNQLVLSASILKALEVKKPARFDLNEFWKHAIGVGVAAETIANFVNHAMPADLFTCGLVHDMGKIALYTLEPDLMVSVYQKCEADGMSYLEAEGALGLVPHVQIGSMLAKKWALPLGIQEAIRHHHEKEHGARGGLTADAHRNIDIVYLSNLLVHALKFGYSGHARVLGAPRETLERLALNPDQDLKTLLHEIKNNLNKASDFLRILNPDAAKAAA